MKLLWLTPVHSRSAIARFSEIVVRRLVEKGNQVVIASTETDFDKSDRRYFLDFPISSFADMEKKGLDDIFDAIIVNFGDHYPNHGLSLDALPFSRVIGIFHDADMTNFGNGMRAAGCELSDLTEGIEGGLSVVAAIAQECGGAVAHSSFYHSIVAESNGPIGIIPLAWTLPKDVAIRNSSLIEQTPSNDKFGLVTFGNINKNKCVDRVIEAISTSTVLRDIVEYRVVGAIESTEHERLSELANTQNVRLVITGPVDDPTLHRELTDADVVSCLREPVLEGASASAIEAMLHGCAVLVSDAGFYADLSDDCVFKIPAVTDAASIRGALEELLENATQRREMGQQARKYSEAVFSPDRYADSLLQLICDVCVTSAYNSTIDSVASQLVGLGMHPKSATVELVLRALEEMAPAERRATGINKQQHSLESFKFVPELTQ